MPSTAQPSTPSATVSTPAASLTNANGGTVLAGGPVYSSAAGYVDKAIDDTAAHARVIGLAMANVATTAVGLFQVANVITLTTAQWDAVCGTSGGLTFGTDYYLGHTAGTITSAAPGAAGRYVTYIGFALSTTQMCLMIQPAIGPIVL